MWSRVTDRAQQARDRGDDRPDQQPGEGPQGASGGGISGLHGLRGGLLSILSSLGSPVVRLLGSPGSFGGVNVFGLPGDLRGGVASGLTQGLSRGAQDVAGGTRMLPTSRPATTTAGSRDVAQVRKLWISPACPANNPAT